MVAAVVDRSSAPLPSGDGASGSGQSAKPAVRSSPTPAVGGFLEPLQAATAVLGIGRAAACWTNAKLRSASPAAVDQFKRTVYIGKEDGWETRGTGGYVNHQQELMGHCADQVPTYDPSFASRQSVVSDNQAQIRRACEAGAQHLQDHVESLGDLPSGGHALHAQGGQAVHVRKLVIASGLGPHIDPTADPKRTDAQRKLQGITIDVPEALKDRVLNIDQFRSATDANPEAFRGKKLVVHGASPAGWDAAERGGELGMDVQWLIRNTRPAFFDGTNLQHAPRIADSDRLMQVRELSVTPSDDGRRLTLICDRPTADRAKRSKTELEADYYVYAFGQDADAALGVRRILGDRVKRLRPVYDMNQVYSDKPWKTVLALRTAGTTADQGIEVIGSSVGVLSRSIPHCYVDDERERLGETLHEQLGRAGIDAGVGTALSDALTDCGSGDAIREVFAHWLATHPDVQAMDEKRVNAIRRHIENLAAATDDLKGRTDVSKEVENQISNTVSSVIYSAQFGAVGGSVMALQSDMPPYIAQGRANFSTDDRTMLRAHIAHSYPNVAPPCADRFIEAVLNIRRMTSQQLKRAVAEQLVNGKLMSDKTAAGQGALAAMPYAADAAHEAAIEVIVKSLKFEGTRDVEGRPTTGLPPAVRERYAEILEEGAVGDVEWSLMQAWLKPRVSYVPSPRR